MFEIPLLIRLVVASQEMAHGVAAEQVAHFFRDILGVIAGALYGLCHQQHVRRMIACHAALVFQMADEDQVASPVDLGIGAQNPDGAVQVLQRERLVDLEQHLLQR